MGATAAAGLRCVVTSMSAAVASGGSAGTAPPSPDSRTYGGHDRSPGRNPLIRLFAVVPKRFTVIPPPRKRLTATIAATSSSSVPVVDPVLVVCIVTPTLPLMRRIALTLVRLVRARARAPPRSGDGLARRWGVATPNPPPRSVWVAPHRGQLVLPPSSSAARTAGGAPCGHHPCVTHRDNIGERTKAAAAAVWRGKGGSAVGLPPRATARAVLVPNVNTQTAAPPGAGGGATGTSNTAPNTAATGTAPGTAAATRPSFPSIPVRITTTAAPAATCMAVRRRVRAAPRRGQARPRSRTRHGAWGDGAPRPRLGVPRPGRYMNTAPSWGASSPCSSTSTITAAIAAFSSTRIFIRRVERRSRG